METGKQRTPLVARVIFPGTQVQLAWSCAYTNDGQPNFFYTHSYSCFILNVAGCTLTSFFAVIDPISVTMKVVKLK